MGIQFCSEDDIITEIQQKIEPRFSSFFVVIDKKVSALHSEWLKRLQQTLKHSAVYCFSACEAHKSRSYKEQIEDRMLEKGCNKATAVIAVGGGVTTDLAGFVAATYFRGLEWIAIPTSLMGMIDAAIGGKTAINTPHGKNTIGAFHPPSEIYIAPSFLQTLDQKEYGSALAEVIKYGCLKDRELLNASLLRSLPSQDLIERCISMKHFFINEQRGDHALRHHLNLGHTVGHGIELIASYKIPHGDAVALGLLVEAKMNHQLGHLSFEDYLQLKDLIIELFPSLPFSCLQSPSSLFEAMGRDKKNTGKQPLISVLSTLGNILEGEDDFTAIDYSLFQEACHAFVR